MSSPSSSRSKTVIAEPRFASPARELLDDAVVNASAVDVVGGQAGDLGRPLLEQQRRRALVQRALVEDPPAGEDDLLVGDDPPDE